MFAPTLTHQSLRADTDPGKVAPRKILIGHFYFNTTPCHCSATSPCHGATDTVPLEVLFAHSAVPPEVLARECPASATLSACSILESGSPTHLLLDIHGSWGTWLAQSSSQTRCYSTAFWAVFSNITTVILGWNMTPKIIIQLTPQSYQIEPYAIMNLCAFLVIVVWEKYPGALGSV